jgi:hypothetical protein
VEGCNDGSWGQGRQDRQSGGQGRNNEAAAKRVGGGLRATGRQVGLVLIKSDIDSVFQVQIDFIFGAKMEVFRRT